MDMLVKLYSLPSLDEVIAQQSAGGIMVRRAIAPEKHVVTAWVRQHFSEFWVSECETAFAHQPVGCFVAAEGNTLLGFSCYDTTRRGFFGPTGVSEAARGRGVGKALLLIALYDMAAQGYGYAIIGGVGPIEFYQKAAGATVIEDSTPGVYGGMLRPQG
jgi:GNAT superfamily N-acetyltransferase